MIKSGVTMNLTIVVLMLKLLTPSFAATLSTLDNIANRIKNNKVQANELILKPFLRITSFPPTLALRGNVSTITCVVEGSPAPSVVWYRNGEPLLQSGTHRSHSGRGAVARLVSHADIRVPERDVDIYTCVIRAGKLHALARTYVQGMSEADTPPPPNILAYYPIYIGNIGAHVTLPCVTARGRSGSAHWTAPRGRDKGARVKLQSLQWTDMGMYTCRVGNETVNTFVYPSTAQ